MVDRSYDHPNFRVFRETHYANAATGTTARLRCGQTAVLDAVYGVITTAGTTTDASATIQVGTTSVGSATLGTSTAGIAWSVTGLSSALTANTSQVNTVLTSPATSDITYIWHVKETSTIV